MSIGVLPRKLLWGRAGNQCAYPDCRQLLTENFGTDESAVLSSAGVVIGEEAHIRSGRPAGPRHDPNFLQDVDTYSNLICYVQRITRSSIRTTGNYSRSKN